MSAADRGLEFGHQLGGLGALCPFGNQLATLSTAKFSRFLRRVGEFYAEFLPKFPDLQACNPGLSRNASRLSPKPSPF
jgi:hypothetical protein